MNVSSHITFIGMGGPLWFFMAEKGQGALIGAGAVIRSNTVPGEN